MKVEFTIGKIEGVEVFYIGKTGSMSIYSNMESHKSAGCFKLYFVDQNNKVKNTLHVIGEECLGSAVVSFEFKDIKND